MFRIETEKEFLNTFRSRDRKHAEPPKGTRFPLFVRDYFAWVDPYGVRVFIVFAAPGAKKPTGIAFRRDQGGDKNVAPHMCEWCRSPGTSDQIGLLTTDVDSKRRVGINLCLDLRCNERLETATNRVGGDVLDEMKHLNERITRFATEALELDVSSAA